MFFLKEIYIYMIKISGKVDKSNAYNGFSSNISFFIQARISSDFLFYHLDDLSLNPELEFKSLNAGVSISHIANTFGKDINLSILPPDIDK